MNERNRPDEDDIKALQHYPDWCTYEWNPRLDKWTVRIDWTDKRAWHVVIREYLKRVWQTNKS